MKDGQQRISSYISGAGLTVYEIEQYHQASDSWYIGGDSTTSLELAKALVELNASRLQLAELMKGVSNEG